MPESQNETPLTVGALRKLLAEAPSDMPIYIYVCTDSIGGDDAFFNLHSFPEGERPDWSGGYHLDILPGFVSG